MIYITDKINPLPDINIPDKSLDLKAKDVRQEPPIPVERIIVSEKPNVEKPDKIAVGSLVPEIKDVVETIKSENLNAQAQAAPNTDAKIDESVTLKAEEKIKIIEEKEQSMDLQKNDNLINLDAIKKEESELAADGDMANARAVERHEQLRKTLEKHKLEQRQMMQEQKEILKDIKEQKQEFEREKQRMAKDEILKKVQIDAKENILPESKSNLEENDKKAVENNEIIIEKNKIETKEVLKEEANNVNKIKLNEKQPPRDENNNIDLAAESSEKKLNLPHEVSHKNVEEPQKISEDVADKFLPIKEAVVDREVPEKLLQKEKQDEKKVERIEFNDSKNMKGPILNVLSKGVLQRSVVEEGLAKEDDNRRTKEERREVLTNEVANTSDKLQAKYDDKYSIPIALKMMNQSKLDKVIVPSLNKSEPEVLASIRRDILENNEREKRDVDREENANDTKVNGDHLTEKSLHQNLIISESPHQKDVDDTDGETCSKLREGSKKSEAEEEYEKRVIKPSTTEVPLINTNLYLSEQRITKTISMDQHAALDSEYADMRQEDSKVLGPKDKTEI